MSDVQHFHRLRVRQLCKARSPHFNYILDQYIGSAEITVEQAEGIENWGTNYYGKELNFPLNF